MTTHRPTPISGYRSQAGRAINPVSFDISGIIPQTNPKLHHSYMPISPFRSQPNKSSKFRYQRHNHPVSHQNPLKHPSTFQAHSSMRPFIPYDADDRKQANSHNQISAHRRSTLFRISSSLLLSLVSRSPIHSCCGSVIRNRRYIGGPNDRPPCHGMVTDSPVHATMVRPRLRLRDTILQKQSGITAKVRGDSSLVQTGRVLRPNRINDRRHRRVGDRESFRNRELHPLLEFLE